MRYPVDVHVAPYLVGPEVSTRPGRRIKRTSVLDRQTGDVYTYRRGAGVPSELPVAKHDSPTTAQFAGWPIEPARLRALLLSQASSRMPRRRRNCSSS